MSGTAQITPSLFVGSSSEGVEAAEAIQVNLERDAEITLWSHGAFGPNEGYLESLVSALDRFDFAILVLTPDDLVSSREIVNQAPRDNVMFELGLFMGRLGRNRTFAVRSDAPTMRLPTDLAGVNLLSFQAERSDGNLIAALGPACTRIRQIIRDLGISETRIAKRLTSATMRFEGISQDVERLIYLMAQSRVLELEVIKNQFGGTLPSGITEQLIADLDRLKAETESQS